MNRRIVAGVAMVALVGAAFGLGQQSGQSKRDSVLVFMRQKLAHSQKVMEGIVKQDYEAIAKHGNSMALLCLDESWTVLQNPEFMERSNEFRRTIQTLTKAARKENLDGCALNYLRMASQCFDCHKAISPPPPKAKSQGKD